MDQPVPAPAPTQLPPSAPRPRRRGPFPLAPVVALAILLVPRAVGALTTGGAGARDEGVQVVTTERVPALLLPAREPREVEARELLANPSRYTGAEVRSALTFAGWSAGWNPYLTRFGPREYRAFEAWTDDQHLWDPEQLANPALRVFVRRGGAAEWALEDAERHARYELTLLVHTAFGGKPWGEVIAVQPLEMSLGEGALVHATRAVQAMNERQWRRAEAELQRALAGPLPAPARAELERLARFCDQVIRPHGHDVEALERQR